MRDIGTKANGSTELDAGDYNSVQVELENIVTSADITLDPAGGPDTDLIMLKKTIAAYANAGMVYQDSGSANVVVLSLATNLQPPNQYYKNMMVVFKVGVTNTGATTINVASLGAKSLTRPNGVALVAGDITTGDYANAVYNQVSDRFELSLYKIIKNATIISPTIADGSGIDGVNSLKISPTIVTPVIANASAVSKVNSVKDQGGVATSGLKCKILEIGPWNMDSTTFINVAHGVDYTKIRSATLLIRGDDDTSPAGLAYPGPSPSGSPTSADVDVWIRYIVALDIQIWRRDGSFFDGTSFNDTAASYNRGWVTIWYEA